MKFWTFMATLTVVAIGFYLVNPYGTASLDPRARIMGITTYRIPSSSMKPTLVRGDFILVKTYAYAQKAPNKSDVVVYNHAPSNNARLGRIIGKPGDLVSVIGARAIVNSKQLNESYVENQPVVCPVKDFKEQKVPKDHFFILGDNRCNSVDSRIFGFVKADNLIGKVFYIWQSNDSDRVGKI